MKIVDNFLDREIFETLQKILVSPDIGWFHQDVVAHDEKDLLDTYFIHTFFANSYGLPRGILSNVYSQFLPLLDKLNVDSLLRLRANNYPRTDKIVQHNFHTDASYPHQTAILYMNTNDGFTGIKDGKKIKKIESIENRALLFDGSVEHCSTTCTDIKSRIVVNVNYITSFPQ